VPSSEAAAALQSSLSRIYGPAVEVRYYDISDPRVQAAHGEIIMSLHEDRLPFPAVFLDGQLISAGAINLLRTLTAVAQAQQRRASEGS
jgi:disulfide oxidoreductase YuzD